MGKAFLRIIADVPYGANIVMRNGSRVKGVPLVVSLSNHEQAWGRILRQAQDERGWAQDERRWAQDERRWAQDERVGGLMIGCWRWAVACY